MIMSLINVGNTNTTKRIFYYTINLRKVHGRGYNMDNMDKEYERGISIILSVIMCM